MDFGYKFQFCLVLHFSQCFNFLVFSFLARIFTFHLFFAVGHSENVRLVFLPGFSVFNDFDFGHHFQFSVVLNTLCDFSISSPLFIINYQHFCIFSFFFLSCQGFAIFCILFPICFLFQVFAQCLFLFYVSKFLAFVHILNYCFFVAFGFWFF